MLLEYVEEVTRVVEVEVPDELVIGNDPFDLKEWEENDKYDYRTVQENIELDDVREIIMEYVAINGWDDVFVHECSTRVSDNQ